MVISAGERAGQGLLFCSFQIKYTSSTIISIGSLSYYRLFIPNAAREPQASLCDTVVEINKLQDDPLLQQWTAAAQDCSFDERSPIRRAITYIASPESARRATRLSTARRRRDKYLRAEAVLEQNVSGQ